MPRHREFSAGSDAGVHLDSVIVCGVGSRSVSL